MSASRGPGNRGRRVCLLLETYWPQVGGGETAGRMLAQGLDQRGWDVSVFTRRSVLGVDPREPDGGVSVHRLPPGGSGPGRKWALAVPAFAAMLAAHGKFDVIVVLGFRVLGAPACAAARILGLPVVLKAESRGEMSGEFFRPGLARLGVGLEAAPVRAALGMRNRILGRADVFVAMSSELRRELLDADVPPERVHRIPNAVDLERFAPPSPGGRDDARRELGVPREARLLVYTGRLVTYKGLPELVEAWPAVASAHPDARLALVGEGGTDLAACEQELRARVESLGVGDTVTFPGAVDDVVPWLNAADGFVFPSRDEAFGLALVEAMACGLPVVTTAIGGLKDIVTDGENGRVIEPDDTRALVGALHELLEGGPEVERLGVGARRTAEQRFAREPVLDAWQRLLESLVESR